MPQDDLDQGSPDANDAGPSPGVDGYRPLDGSVDLSPPSTGLSNPYGVTFHPLTDPALDQHYADLANQHDPDPTPGLLGTFQQWPPDGISNRWRYTPPDIPGEPATDGDGNPCPAWLVSRRIRRTGYLADHNFVVVAGQVGGAPQARFSYGPTEGGNSRLVSVTGSKDFTDSDDVKARKNAAKPLSGIRVQQIPASDEAVINAGQNLNRQLGTSARPGPIPYALVPDWVFTGANSNSAAAKVVNDAIHHDHPGAAPMLPYPGSWPFGWGTSPTRR